MLPRYQISIVDKTDCFGDTVTDAKMIKTSNGGYIEYADFESIIEEQQKNVVSRWKFDALVEHCKKLEHLNNELTQTNNQIRLYDNKEVWFWEKDEDNHLESIVCPVVIDANVLRELVKRDDDV